MHEGSGEPGRHFTARGEWPLHGHNEMLDAAADGGLPALLILLFACGWIVLRIWRLPASCERNWLLLSVGGVLVVSCVDNVYSRIVGLWYVALVAGLVANAVARVQGPPDMTASESPRPIRLTMPLMASGAVSLIMAWSVVPTAWVSGESHKEDLRAAFAAVFDPEPLATLYPFVMDALPLGDFERDLVSDQHQRRIGSSRTTIWYTVLNLAASGAPSTVQFENILDYIRYVPFNNESWKVAVTLVQSDPGLLKDLDKNTKYALRRMSGDPRLPLPSPGLSCSDMSAAISTACALRWCLITGNFNEDADRTAERLIDGYGDVLDVGVLICDLLCAGRDIQLTPKRCRIMYPAVTYGERYWREKIMGITDPIIAKRLIPLLISIYPAQYREIGNGHITRGQRPLSDDYLHLRQALCHLWSLAQR
jgi:hypothetical protein